MNAKRMAVLAGFAVAAAGCGDLVASPGAAVFVRYTPDGTLVVFAGVGIDLYSPDLSVKKAYIPTAPANWDPNNSVEAFSVSGDGSVAAISYPNYGAGANEVDLFDLSSGARLPQAISLGLSAGPGDNYTAGDLALSPSGDLLFVVDGVDRIFSGTGMFDTSTGARLWTSAGEIRPIFSPDESTVYVLSNNDFVDLEAMAARTGTTTLDVPFTVTVQSLAAMPDADTLIGLTYPLQCAGGSPCPYAITFFSTVDGSITRQIPLLANTESTAQTFPDRGFRCSTAAGLCVVSVVDYDPATGNQAHGWVQVWSTDGTLVQSIQVFGDLAEPNDADVSPDGQYVAVVLSDGDVAVYRISDGKLVGRDSGR